MKIELRITEKVDYWRLILDGKEGGWVETPDWWDERLSPNSKYHAGLYFPTWPEDYSGHGLMQGWGITVEGAVSMAIDNAHRLGTVLLDGSNKLYAAMRGNND